MWSVPTTTASAASAPVPSSADERPPQAPGPGLPPAGPSCLNCYSPLPEPTPKFCPECGQETRHRPPRLGEFVQQFGGAYLSTEGALWRTLALLLLRPGELTRRYLAGRRKHYVLPLRLYLTISLVVLLGLRAVADVEMGTKIDAGDIQGLQNFQIEFGVARAGLKEGAFYCENMPKAVCTRLQRRLDLDPKSVQREVADFSRRLVANLGAAMFVLVPMFALWSKLLWWDRRRYYTEHLVFALHLHAFWFIAVSLSAFGVKWLSSLAALSIPVYGLLAAHRVFGGRWWSLLLRTSVGGLLYLITLAVVMAGLTIITLIF
jgi:hypothetical protein